jgi:hypothetical protein
MRSGVHVKWRQKVKIRQSHVQPTHTQPQHFPTKKTTEDNVIVKKKNGIKKTGNSQDRCKNNILPAKTRL